jgi:hypothetical protein
MKVHTEIENDPKRKANGLLCPCALRIRTLYPIHLLYLFAALSFGAFAVPVIQAAPPAPFPLPSGDWAVDADGTKGILHISVIGGVLQNSTIFSNPIVGSYDSTAARISFIRLNTTSIHQQVYTAYLFKDPSTGFFTTYNLDGEFQAYSNVPAERSVLGWHATLLSPIPIPLPPVATETPNPVPNPGPVR